MQSPCPSLGHVWQVGASLEVFRRDAALMRGPLGPVVFAQAKHGLGVGAIADHVVAAFRRATEENLH